MFRGVMISNLKPSPTFSSVATRVVPSVGQNMPVGPMGSTKVRLCKQSSVITPCADVTGGGELRYAPSSGPPGSSASPSSAWRADTCPQQRLELMLRAVLQPASGLWPGHGTSYAVPVHIVCTISMAWLPSEGILFDMTRSRRPSRWWAHPRAHAFLTGREALTRE